MSNLKNDYDYGYLKDIFLKYVQIDTQSDENNESETPSTKKQFDLANMIAKDLENFGLKAEVTKNAYVTVKIEGNVKNAPGIGFIAHLDTAPGVSGKNVKPIVHENYNGKDIKLPKDNQIIKLSDFSELKDLKGATIITTDGSTLLGADDKAGISLCMGIAKFLHENKDFAHGDIVLIFTPDEEIGHGADLLDIKSLGISRAYTLDGSGHATLCSETFCADMADITFFGRDIHPGASKNKMVNALRLATDFISQIPAEYRPETTEDQDGFIHPLKIEGDVSSVTIKMILRDFIEEKLPYYKTIVENVAKGVCSRYSHESIGFKLNITKQYRNMKYKLDKEPRVTTIVAKAMEECGLDATMGRARGGTDGARLSYRGLLTPDISVSYYGMHSQTEWLCIDQLNETFDVVLKTIELWSKEQ